VNVGNGVMFKGKVMIKTNLPNFVVCAVLVLLVVVAVEGVASADSASIETVKRQTKSFVREIRSIEFEMLLMGTDVRRESSEKISRKETMRYFQSGNMFRSETVISLNGESLGDEISTYTGKRFQVFKKNIETMAVKDSSIASSATRVISPLVDVYSFLVKMGMTYTWTEITTEKNIDDSFKHAKYIGKRENNGAECIVLEFPGVVPGFTVEVWFSREKNYFPVKYTFSINGSPQGVCEVKKFHEENLDSGAKVFIPVEIVSVSNYPGRSPYSSSERTISIDANTIKINHEIDDDFFTLPTTIAKHVDDIDRMIADGTLLEPGDDLIEQQSITLTTVVLIIVNIVFVSLLIYRFFLTKFK